ncbi:MAG TPA: hypothetical protein VNP73_02065 [Actinomycetota bacterium]|nr:hypothetical protein [Actinomycetota bacterium]
MDESNVRQKAQAHGAAMVAGDVNKAGGDLTQEAMAGAGAVMKEMPRQIDSAEITDVAAAGDGFTVLIRYSGEGKDVTVKSVWIDKDGDPKIAELSLA